jgi:hypothetical protein
MAKYTNKIGNRPFKYSGDYEAWFRDMTGKRKVYNGSSHK